jgi:sterol desaturase/sphingolipid hydroxylase (fatty acid hydroxylase superfamily)
VLVCGTQVLLLLITNSPILPPSTLIFRCFPAFASLQLLAVDFLQWGAHRLEHVIKPLYMRAHVPHHKWRSPSLFEAFEGSMTDTIVMIVIPLFLSAHGIAFLSKFMLPFVIAPTAVDYMIFGTIYANFLCLIHSPRVHPWEDTRTLFGRLVRALGIGTAADHHVHHFTYSSNFGHLFTVWDRMSGRYKSPSNVKTFSMYQSFVET